MNEKEILVLGVGNYILSDEGVGIHVIHELQNMPLTPNVEVIDGGTGSFELIEHFRGRKKVIIVDAVKTNDKPGTLFRFTPDDVEFIWSASFYAHQLSMHDLLHFVNELKPVPEIVIYGIVPEETTLFSTHLSKKVKRRIKKIISEIIKEIQ
jgi:hydrogenase maturation protease